MAIVVLYSLTAVTLGGIALYATSKKNNDFGIDSGRWWALAFGVGMVALGLLVLEVLGADKRYGVFRPLIGGDRRFSTSLTQVGLWTLAIVTAFGYLLGRVMFDGVRFSYVLSGKRWDEYLLLLGGPFAAAVVAKGVVTYKLESGSLQKTEPQSATPTQIVTADNNAADLIDAQYLLFNVIALGYFVVQLAKISRLPEIPSPLLALTGATAATYVANKAAQKNAPTITSVSPTSAQAGDEVRVFGTNFDPGDPTDLSRRITIQLSGYTGHIYPFDSTDTRVRFYVPAGAAGGHQTIAVTSTAGVQTEPHDLEVLARTAMVTETTSAQGLRPGSRATLRGKNLGRPGDAVTVKLGTMMAAGTPNADGTELTFQVPDPLPDPASGTVEATISVPGQTDLVRTFPVEQPRVRAAWRVGNAVRVTADGLSANNDFVPRVIVNGRTSPAVAHLERRDFEVTLPTSIAIDGALELIVFDDLGRKSAAYELGATT